MKPIPESILLRKEEFLSKIKILENGCWEWQSHIGTRGYGQFLKYRAHRFSYALHKGDPGEFLCCHHCDYKKCVNPDHLFLGTAQDNTNDMIKKGRNKFSGSHFDSHSCITTPEDIESWRKEYVAGKTSLREVARKFGTDHRRIAYWLRHIGIYVKTKSINCLMNR